MINVLGIYSEKPSEFQSRLIEALENNENISRLLRIAKIEKFEVYFQINIPLNGSYFHVLGLRKILYIGIEDITIETINKVVIVLAHEIGHIFGSKTESEDSPLPERIKEEILAWKIAQRLLKGFLSKKDNKLAFLEISSKGINSRVFKLTTE
jgi:hypothetical protein